MVRAVTGTVSARSQQDLRDSLRAQNYFLACRCYPDHDLTVEARNTTLRTGAAVAEVEWLRESIVRLRLKTKLPLPYRAGQFVNLILPDGTSRSYSLASLPEEDCLEVHVRVLQGGLFSDWLRQHARPAAEISVEGPLGDCFYVAENQEGGLLLAGNGTGIGPLWGIARDAIRSGHSGPIWLFHGATDASGLYLDDPLRRMATTHPQFNYVPSVLHGEAPEGGYAGPLDQVMSEVMSQRWSGLSGWRSYLCGDPTLVMALRRRCYGAGIAIHDIHADEFKPAA